MSYFKITFAFDPSVLMSPMCLPRHVLDEQINKLLDYIKPRVTHKTRVYQETLENMLERLTFEEEYINYADGWRRGKKNILFIESIRTQEVTFRDTLSDAGKEWWDSIE